MLLCQHSLLFVNTRHHCGEIRKQQIEPDGCSNCVQQAVTQGRPYLAIVRWVSSKWVPSDDFHHMGFISLSADAGNSIHNLATIKLWICVLHPESPAGPSAAHMIRLSGAI